MRIGLRQVRTLKKGETIWDQSLPGFGARRQNSEAVSYFLYYRTAEGRQRWYTIGKHGVPGHRTPHGRKHNVSVATLPANVILPPRNGSHVKLKPSLIYATTT